MSSSHDVASKEVLSGRVDELLRTHIHDRRSPAFEEVRELVYELEQGRNELELQNQELAKVQQRLEAYRDRYVDLYDFAPLGYVTLDEDGYVQETNLAGTKLLGADRDGLIGYPFLRYVAQEDGDAFLEHLHNCVGRRQEVVSEMTLVANDGRPIAVQLRSIPISEPEMQITWCKTAITDITERKRAEEEIRQAQQRVLELQRREKERVEAELNKARDVLVRQTRLATVGQLSVSIAHNLRNPLGGIRNAAYLLKRKIPPQDSKCHEYLSFIEEELVAANEIITACVAISQGRPLSKRQVALAPILTQARSHVAAADDIQWRYLLEPEPFIVSADADQLEQVFKQLFLNSIEGLGHSGTITVEAVHAGSYDEILVRDDGPGVRQDMRDRLFEPLATTKSRGTGLGLTLCRQIVEQHGGTIELLPDNALGAVFQIRLPSSSTA